MGRLSGLDWFSLCTSQSKKEAATWDLNLQQSSGLFSVPLFTSSQETWLATSPGPLR